MSLGGSVLAVVLAACNGGGGEPSPTAGATQAAATATVAATPTADPLAATEADGARALETVRELSERIGPRTSGTPEEIEARDYLAARLRSYGYDVTVQEFTFDASQFLPARVDAGEGVILAVALQGSSPGVAGGRLVAAGAGRPEEFPADARGAIVLIRRGELAFREMAENARAVGAAGLLVSNNTPGMLLGDLDGASPLQAAGIRQVDGDGLAARLNAGEVVDVRMEIEETTGTSFNVVARPAGAEGCETVTGGHYDSVPVTGGANDNASGTAAVVETARVVAARRMGGAHCFVLFGAEEFGLFGSREFVARMSDEEINGLRGMVNLDVVGLPQELELIGSEDLVREAGIIADGLGLPSRPSFIPSGLGSDHLSFLNAGVPVVFLYRHDELIHTPEDAIGRMSEDSLAQTVTVAAALLAEMVQ